MVYLFIYSSSFGDRQELKDYFDSCLFIEHWRCDLPNCFYLVSEETAYDISRHIKEKFPNSRYLLTEISSNRQGWLPKSTWNFIHENEG